MQTNLHTSSQPNYCAVFNMEPATQKNPVKGEQVRNDIPLRDASTASSGSTQEGAAQPVTRLSDAVARQGIAPDTLSEVQSVASEVSKDGIGKSVNANATEVLPESLVAAVDQLLVVVQSFLTALSSLLSATWDVIKEVLKAPGSGSATDHVTPDPGTADPVTPPSGSVTPLTPELANDWEKTAGNYLVPGGTGLISESQVQEGIVAFQVAAISDDALSTYRETLAQVRQESSGTQTVLKRTLSSLVTSKILTQQQAVSIYSNSHRAAQLDSSTGAISTTQREGKGLSEAIRISTENMRQIASGQIEVSERGIE